MGVLYTFYSYKGGVGRSMALANVAAMLSSWGHSVLAIDWDLEAPGLEKYFMKEPSLVEGSRKEKPGIVDLVTAFENERPLNWEECLLQVYPFGKTGNRLEILSAGQDSPEYVSKLQKIDWRLLFNERQFGAYLEGMRDEWLLKYDFVLVDSRTGITDIGGVCTIHLPDYLVVLFTANDQSLEGVLDVVDRANSKFDQLPEEYERPPKLLCMPVPSRFEYLTEYESATRWLKKFAESLKPIYAEWLPPTVTPDAALEKLFIPNIPFWSFGEGLPVVQEGTTNPRSLGFAYGLLARMLKHRLQWNDAMRTEDAITDDSPPEVVNQAAERAFSSLSDEYAEAAPRLLTRMVLITPAAGHDARRRVALSEFNEKDQAVIKALADARLLSVTQQDGDEIVEIARDATLRYWERLKKWIAADREFLLWRQKLDGMIAEWHQENQDSAYLLKGSALETAKRYADERISVLTPEQIGYIFGSNTQEVLVQQRRRRIRTQVLISTILVLTVFAILGYRSYRTQQQARAFSLAVLSTSKGIDKFSQGDTQGAIQSYNEALGNKDDYDAAYLNRGEAYLNLANASSDRAESDRLRSLAISDFQKAAELTTDNNTKITAQQFGLQAQNPIVPRHDPSRAPDPRFEVSPYPSASPLPSPSSIPETAPRVYIQALNDADSRNSANFWQERLIKYGYSLAPVSYVEQVPNVTELRYYRKSDAKEASEICSLLPCQPKYLVGFENSTGVRGRHFELWIAKS